MRPREADLIDGLTPKQFQVLRSIAAFHGRRRYSPTIAELATQLRLSRSTVFEHLSELQRKSLLTTSAGRARSSRLTPKGRRLLRDTPDEEPPPDTSPEGVALVGAVAAGLPVEAVENADCLSLRSCFGTGDELFALEVRGDSMIEENIRPGDYAICRRTDVAEDGELVVALVNGGEATLKRFHRERDRARLQPANSSYAPIYADDCHIQGVVVGLVRKF